MEKEIRDVLNKYGYEAVLDEIQAGLELMAREQAELGNIDSQEMSKVEQSLADLTGLLRRMIHEQSWISWGRSAPKPPKRLSRR
jgi:hypothetical protein